MGELRLQTIGQRQLMRENETRARWTARLIPVLRAWVDKSLCVEVNATAHVAYLAMHPRMTLIIHSLNASGGSASEKAASGRELRRTDSS